MTYHVELTVLGDNEREVYLDDIEQVAADDDGDLVITHTDGTPMMYQAGTWDGLFVVNTVWRAHRVEKD